MIRTWTRWMAAGAMLAGLAMMAAGCANPADDVPSAVVNDPQPEPAPGESAAPSIGAAPGAEVPAPTPADPAVPAPVAASPGTPTTTTTLAIAPDLSKVDFVGSKVTGSHSGGFKDFTGTLDLGGDGSELTGLSAEIVTDSLWSDNDRLTGHLKSPDFFDATKFPKATFVATEVKPGGADGATHTVTGNLTLHGVTKSITFPVRFKADAATAALDSEFSINRKDFGIQYAGQTNDLIRDEVVIKLAIKAPRGRG